jgi:hypothetical protein
MTQLASLLSKLHLLGRRGKSPTASASASAPEYIAPLTKRAPSTAYVAPCQKTANTASHPAAASRPRAASCQHSPRSTSQSAPAHLSIPCPAPTLEERTRDTHQNRALRLVRQEDWATLSHQIRQADTARTMPPGGMSVADLMAFGARADVVLAAEHALLERTPPKDAPLFAGIEALEFVLDEHAQDYVVACIVAQAHIDLAWAWRGIGWDVEIAPRNREAFEAHLARAREIVAPFSDNPDSSTLLAGSICAMLRGKDFNSKTMADRYEALIDLNPYNTAPLRALGVQMLPRWHGSYDALELEARRTAARTSATWGAGGYVWVMFDAISVDHTACARLDLEFFTEGLRDIIARRPDPHPHCQLRRMDRARTPDRAAPDDLGTCRPRFCQQPARGLGQPLCGSGP